MGYHRAGFDVVGVDIAPQPNYPFEFVQGDALEYAAVAGSDFDAIHASPPCQSRTTMGNRFPEARARHPQLIAPTRETLLTIGRPWVIENVPGARRDLRDPITLSGGMFNLGVERPRLFESSVPLRVPAYRRADPVIGVYGRAHDGRRLWSRKDGSELRAARTLVEGRLAMGVGWMAWHELTEAIPPSYTEWIGRQLISQLAVAA